MAQAWTVAWGGTSKPRQPLRLVQRTAGSLRGGMIMARKRKRPIELLSPDEVGKLIKVASNRAPSGIRNRALIAVLYYSGLRLAEALALLPRDVDLERGEINVRCGKGGKQRLAGLNAEAQAHLSRWMETRRRLGINGRQPVFCTHSKVNGVPRIMSSRDPEFSRYPQAL